MSNRAIIIISTIVTMATLLALALAPLALAQTGEGIPDISALTQAIAQAMYASRNLTGDYPQVRRMRISPLATPVLGIDCPPDQVDCPAFTQLDMASIPISMTITINAYTAPEGDGYEIEYLLPWGGWLWRRIVAYGPEADRARTWYVAESESLGEDLPPTAMPTPIATPTATPTAAPDPISPLATPAPPGDEPVSLYDYEGVWRAR